MPFKFNIDLGDLRKSFATVNRVVERADKNATNRSLRKAAKPISVQTKANVKGASFDDSSGALHVAIGYTVKRLRGEKASIALIGARTSPKYYRNHGDDVRKPAEYIHFLEEGTSSGVDAYRFLEDAYNVRLPQALRIFNETYGDIFDQEMEKASRRL